MLTLGSVTGFQTPSTMTQIFALHAEKSEAFPFLERPEKLDGANLDS